MSRALRAPALNIKESMAIQSYVGRVQAPELPAGLDWLNVTRPLTLEDLRGRLAILDFWTFC